MISAMSASNLVNTYTCNRNVAATLDLTLAWIWSLRLIQTI